MILVTGATGFIGSHLVRALTARGYPVRAALRRPEAAASLPAGVEGVAAGDVQDPIAWSPLLRGIDMVIHLAGRAHVLRETYPAAESLYQAVNAAGTAALADAAAASGVRRFVFVSSSKVLGEATPPGVAWTEDTLPEPQDAYGRSKLAAERALQQIAQRTGMELVILRPPVVYGPGVGANIYMLLRLVDAGVPLPLGSVRSRRSLVSVGNLVSAIELVATHPGAGGQLLHVTDGEDLSAADLVRRIAEALGRPARLIPFPAWLLRAAGRTGDLLQRVGLDVPLNTANVVRLVASLLLDSGRLRARLGWWPPETVREGLARTARWYTDAKGRNGSRRLG